MVNKMPIENLENNKPIALSIDEDENKQNEKDNDDDNEEDVTSITSSRTTRSSVGSQKSSKRRFSGRRKSNKHNIAGYKFNSSYTENHNAVIYACVFNHFLSTNESPIFATVGSNRCSIYKCGDEDGIQLLLCYADPDPDEAFYTCIWSYCRRTMQSLLIAGGQRGVIRIINTTSQQNHCNIAASLIGHGGAINQLKIHQKQVHLLLSCSKDYAIRLWNMETKALIAIFGGVEGHRAEVLSVDFDLRGEHFVSGGMDHALKLWDISNNAFQQRIELSKNYNATRAVTQFPTLMQHYPIFSTREIHGNYVDCVQWFGKYIISKSCQDLIIIWRIGERKVGGDKLKTEIIAQFKCNNCELWFVRFGFNVWCHMLACGNELGKIYVWELSQSGPQDARSYILTRKNCKATVRQVAFSKNAKILIAVCDDATIWRWNKN